MTGTWSKVLLTGVCLLGMQAATVLADCSPDPYAHETVEQRNERMAWFREAKFGLFIHWGVYAVPAGTYQGKQIPNLGEHIMKNGGIPIEVYKAYAREFNPTQYDPESWVLLAREAGMKYIVITAKHHDGFALFDSKVSDWDVVDATPYGKDLIAPLAAACKKHGIKLGLYYSQAQDWCQGGSAQRDFWDPAQSHDKMDGYIDTIAVPQVKEILTRYGPIAVLWWDTPVAMNKERAAKLVDVLKLQPGIIHNDRLGGGFQGDTTTPEQRIPATGIPGRDWETCMTMNHTWGFKSYDHDWKSTEVLLRNLIDIVSKGGNYLLNVGPTKEGLIPQPSVQRLKEVGRWMAVNGESLYGTTASPFAQSPWGRCTKKVHDKGTTLYLQVFDWPADGKLQVPGLRNTVNSARLLATGAALTVAESEEGVTVALPGTAPDPIASVVVLEVAGTPDIVKILVKPQDDGTFIFPARLVDLHNPDHGAQVRVERKYGGTNIGYWLDDRAWVSWTFEKAKAGTYEVVAEVAGPDDSKAILEVGGEKLAVTFAKTGGYGNFQPQVLGRIRIAGPAEQQLSVRPVKASWNAVNVRRVVLRPVAAKKKGKGPNPKHAFDYRFSDDLKQTPDSEARLDAWFRDAKYGAFIHFGAYSPLAGEYKGRGAKWAYSEWIQVAARIPADEYRQVAAQFNPVEFDAEEWVRVFKEGGLRYVVITSKHHDGFALFKSAVSPYNVVDATPFKRDIIKELSEACHRHGLKFGVYYSHAQDWNEPHSPSMADIRIFHPALPGEFKPDMEQYLEKKALPQVEELVKNYEIDLVWFDTPVGMTHERAERFRDRSTSR